MSVCRSCLISNWRDSKRIQRSSTLHDSESEIVEMVQYIKCECARSVSFCHIYGTLSSSDTVIMERIDLAISKQGFNDLGDLKLGRLYMWCQFLGPVNLNWEAKVVGGIGNNNFLRNVRFLEEYASRHIIALLAVCSAFQACSISNTSKTSLQKWFRYSQCQVLSWFVIHWKQSYNFLGLGICSKPNMCFFIRLAMII